MQEHGRLEAGLGETEAARMGEAVTSLKVSRIEEAAGAEAGPATKEWNSPEKAEGTRCGCLRRKNKPTMMTIVAIDPRAPLRPASYPPRVLALVPPLVLVRVQQLLLLLPVRLQPLLLQLLLMLLELLVLFLQISRPSLLPLRHLSRR